MITKSENIIPNNSINNKENNNPNNNSNLFMTNYEKENINNKIYLIQKQFEIKQTQYINQIQLLNNQIKIIKENQTLLKNKLELKDKAISEFNDIIKDYQIELLKYKEELDKKTEKYLKYKEKLKLLKSKYTSLNNTTLSSYDKNIYDLKMKELIESISDKNEKMNQMQNKINELEIIKNEYIIKNKNLENEIKENKKINEELNKDIEIYKNEIDNIKKKNKELEISFNEKNKILEEKISELNSDNNNIIKETNDNINCICTWIENYLLNYEKNNIPLLNIKQKENKIDFIKLMKLLENIKTKIVNDNDLLIKNKKEKEENDINNNNYHKKYDELKNEIKDIYNNLLKEVQENKLFEYKEDNNNKEFNSNNLSIIVNEYIKYINEFIKDKDNMNIMNKILEKKINNLETNIELKQMEINSLQEIIERRANINNSQNIDDFLNSTDNSLKEIKYNFTK